MINVIDRRKEIIQWHFPDDKENPTIFHLKWLSGQREAYLRVLRQNDGKELSEKEWLAEKFLNHVVKIENWQVETGKPKTLTKPDEIKQAFDLLSEDEIWIITTAIRRDGDSYKLGVIEKN